MGEFFKKWCGISLIIRIAAGLAVGIALGLSVDGLRVLSIFGSVFVGALRSIAPLIVFILVMSSLANAGSGLGSRFRTIISLYVVSTLLAAVTAVIACWLFPVTISLDVSAATSTPPGGISEVLSNLLLNMVQNPILSLAHANYVGILFWAVIMGLMLKKLASQPTLTILADFASMTNEAVRLIIQFAPFGIMGLVYDAVRESGVAIFAEYGRLVVLLVGCMIFVAVVVDPLLAALFMRRNPYRLALRCYKDSAVTAFFTRSSASNIPVNLALCDRLGLDPDFYSVSIPLGATINMDGAAVTITIMTLTAAHTLGVNVDIPSAILLSIIATLGACGASGVAGGSLLLIPMACSLLGIGNDIAMQVVAVGFIIGVIQDSLETALNSSADVLFTATAEYRERSKKGDNISI